jgi:hypothetical protein
MSYPNPDRPSRYVTDPRGSGCVRPGTILTTRDPFAEVMTFLRRLSKEKFYGTCSVIFREGQIEIIRTEQTIRVGSLPSASVMPSDLSTPNQISTRTTGDHHDDQL